MATVIKTNSGKKITLLNPAEKGKRYARQLKSGVIKETKTTLSPEQRAYRMGYLNARSDSTKVFNANKSKGDK